MQVSFVSLSRCKSRMKRLRSQFLSPIFMLSLAVTPALGAGGPPSLRTLSGADQQTTYASAFVKPLTVWVYDPTTERSLVGVRVNFTAALGIRVSESFAITDELGTASVTAIGSSVGSSSVQAEIQGFPTTAVRFENLVINKAVLTVVPVDVQSIVGAIPEITEYRIQGFVNGDNEDSANISGVPVLTTIATENSPDANYAIKGGVGSLDSPNYTFKAGFGALVLRGIGKPSRSIADADNKPAKGNLQQDGSPVVQSAIRSIKVANPIAFQLGPVHTVNMLPASGSAQPAALYEGTVRKAVFPQAPPPLEINGATVRPGVFGQQAHPPTATSLGSAGNAAVRNALPSASESALAVPGTPKPVKIQKAFNPPTPN